MHDKTYCVNGDCPFKECDRHKSHAPKFHGFISVANFDATCEKYISYLVSEVAE